MLPSAPLVITIAVGGAGFTKCSVTHSTTIRRSTNGTSVSVASRHETAEMRKRGINTMESGSRPELERGGPILRCDRALYGKHAAPGRKCDEAILELTERAMPLPKEYDDLP